MLCGAPSVAVDVDADVAANVVHVAKFDVDLDKHGYSGILQILQGKLGDQLLLDPIAKGKYLLQDFDCSL